MSATCPVVHPDKPSVTCIAGGIHQWHLGTDPATGEVVEWQTPVPPAVGTGDVVAMVRRARERAARPAIPDGTLAPEPGQDWKDVAYRIAVHLAETRDEFCADDVWARLDPSVRDDNPRGMGIVMSRLANEGWAEPTDRVRSSAFRKGHVKEWRSLVRTPEPPLPLSSEV
jgi:hypothetical protein